MGSKVGGKEWEADRSAWCRGEGECVGKGEWRNVVTRKVMPFVGMPICGWGAGGEARVQAWTVGSGTLSLIEVPANLLWLGPG